MHFVPRCAAVKWTASMRVYSSQSAVHVNMCKVYNSTCMPEQLKKKLQEEIAVLEHELTHELPQEIKKAVAMGDLTLINMSSIPKDKVGLGSKVRVFDSTKNEEVEYKLVTSEETDVSSGKISTTSPIGRALLNKKVGDTVTVMSPNGNREVEILTLSTIYDEAEA